MKLFQKFQKNKQFSGAGKIYPLLGLDFSADTHWDEFLEAYLNTSGQTAVQQAVEPLPLETDGLYAPQKLK